MSKYLWAMLMSGSVIVAGCDEQTTELQSQTKQIPKSQAKQTTEQQPQTKQILKPQSQAEQIPERQYQNAIEILEEIDEAGVMTDGQLKVLSTFDVLSFDGRTSITNIQLESLSKFKNLALNLSLIHI